MNRQIAEDEIDLIRESSLLVAKTHAEISALIIPGVTTLDIDKLGEEFIRDNGGLELLKVMVVFQIHYVCHPNEQVVHGIPNDKPLEDGTILSVDCGVYMNGYYGDSAYTYEVGEVSEEVKNLLLRTKESLYLGIDQAISGNRIGDIGFAIQRHVEQFGYGVVREMVGHGVGEKLHESPEVPNYGKRGRGIKLKEGMVIAIEPMINLGTKNIKQLSDGWTVITTDRKYSAHFEHTIVVRKGKAEILSSFDEIEKRLKK